jgi:hypothetical protein
MRLLLAPVSKLGCNLTWGRCCGLGTGHVIGFLLEYGLTVSFMLRYAQMWHVVCNHCAFYRGLHGSITVYNQAVLQAMRNAHGGAAVDRLGNLRPRQ